MNSADSLKNQAPRGLSCGEYIYSAEGDRNILYADDNVVRLFGCDSFEDLLDFLGNSFPNMLHPDDYAETQRGINMQTTKAGHRHGYLKYRIITKQGDIRYTESFGHNALAEDGHVYYYVFIAEIDQDEYYNEYYNSFAEGQVDAMSWKVDRVTGLRNIGAFKDELESFTPDAETGVCTVAVLDIIGLHKINREEGRSEGDKQIRSLVHTIITSIPQNCSVYRGYDAEIIVVFPDKSEEKALQLVKSIIDNCSNTVYFGIASTNGVFINGSPSQKTITVPQALEDAEFDLSIKKMLTDQSGKSQALTSLVCALKEVDQDTEEHVERTRNMGVALGKRLGLSDVQLTTLELLCLLHDIGKIAIPLEILNKPGKLNDAEWAALRSHADKGYQIAIAAKELKPIADQIRYHHERWDGKGYPTGLSGEMIPILSRIISLVDSYDAMVNDRSYRKALSPEYAMQEIRDNAGTQFDPVIAQAFLELLCENEDLKLGKKTSGGEIRTFKKTTEKAVKAGNTQPVIYCEYKLNVDDIIAEVGPSFETLTGYKPDEVLGKMSQYDLIPKEDLNDYMLQVGNQFSRSDTALLRHRIQRKDGAIITVICNGKRQFDSATRAFMSTMQVYEV